jgi:hypothetical protein
MKEAGAKLNPDEQTASAPAGRRTKNRKWHFDGKYDILSFTESLYFKKEEDKIKWQNVI